MYKEITIDPACMAEYEYYTLLKTSFGFEKGRYLTVSIREWVVQAVKAIKASSMSPIKQKSVKNFLNQLQKDKTHAVTLLAFERRKVANDVANDWVKWQAIQSQEKLFNAIISEQKFDGSICHSNIMDNHENWDIPPTIQVHKTPEEIYRVIEPIIEISRVVTIVDPYFSLANNQVLSKILLECQNNLSLKSIKLVTAINTATPQKVFDNEYKNVFANLPNFELIVVDNAKSIHDRYLYSDSACVKAGQGFSDAIEKGVQSDLVSFNIAGKKEVKHLHEHIDSMIANGNAKLTILHNRVI